MGKLDPKRLPRGERDELMREIVSVFGKLGLSNEGKILLRNILTESEVIMLARRMQIARRLLAGQSFRKITDDLHVGLTTIRHVHHFLEERFDDYQSFLCTLGRRKSGGIALQTPLDSSAFQALRHRYPMDYILFNILLHDPLKDHESVWS